jgi:hypothetical protein
MCITLICGKISALFNAVTDLWLYGSVKSAKADKRAVTVGSELCTSYHGNDVFMLKCDSCHYISWI